MRLIGRRALRVVAAREPPGARIGSSGPRPGAELPRRRGHRCPHPVDSRIGQIPWKYWGLGLCLSVVFGSIPTFVRTPAGPRGRCPMTVLDDPDTTGPAGSHWEIYLEMGKAAVGPLDWLTGQPSVLAHVLKRPVQATDALLLNRIDVEAISEPAELIDFIAVTARLEARLAAMRLAAEATFAAKACPDSTSAHASFADAAAEQEVAYATHNSMYGASKEIDRARALKELFPGFGAALAAGEITERHCAVLVDQTRHITDPEVLATIETQALEKARTLTPSELRRHLDKLIARHDPDATVRAHK
ncbi:MAG: DUF222 domain-containing protein, partial [Frankiales bacterium]|nr:DUF222 domain-containing protein [Frankiales bacterium]